MEFAQFWTLKTVIFEDITHTYTHTYTHTHSQTHTPTHTHTDRVVPDIVVTFGPLWIPGASCLLLAGGALGTGGFLITLPDVPANAQRQVGSFCATSQMPTLHLGQTLNHSTPSDIMFLRITCLSFKKTGSALNFAHCFVLSH